MGMYLKLLGSAMIPVILSVGFYFFKRTTAFSGLQYRTQQIIIGVAFGLVAIYGTAFGVDVGGAIANARDAAPLCAGLFFGGPAGIIAGTIGALYRWFASYWGAGMFTRIACTVSTFIAGIYAALLRKFIFEDRTAKWYISFLIGVIIESFHLAMVFFTHSHELSQALEIVKICAMPMVLVNSIALALTAAAIALIDRILFKKELGSPEKKSISERIQLVILLIVMVSFVITHGFSYILQTNQAKNNIEKLLETNIRDTTSDISDLTDRTMLEYAEAVAREYDTDQMRNLTTVSRWYDVSDVNIIDSNGIITDSSDRNNIGFNMYSGKQSGEFMKGFETSNTVVQELGPISRDESITRKYSGAKTLDGGYIQIGCSEKKLYKKIAKAIESVSSNRHIGNTGYLMIVDPNYKIISCPDKSMLSKNLMNTGVWIWDNSEQLQVYEVQSFGLDCYMMYQEEEGYKIIGVYPKKEAMGSRDFNLYLTFFTQVLVFAFMFAAVYFSINRVVLKKLNSVNTSLEEITGGNLNEVVDVRNTAEFDKLSDEINTTVGRLKQYIAEAAARIDAELEFAKNIQLSTLPSNFPAFPDNNEFDIYATMNAAKVVGGDFYDFYMPQENKLAFLIADVSGKGIPAAMFMMQAKTMINGLTAAGLSVETVFTMANENLCANNEAEMFVTAWQGILDITDGHVEFANAGHNPPVVYCKGEGWSYLKSRAGFVLAGMEGLTYKKQELDLQPGDKIFLYTDGIVEAQNTEQELYGEERLLEYLNEHCDEGPEAVLKGVKKDVDDFAGEAEQFDDMTMLMVSYFGPGQAEIETQS